ncbi:hypothetical protein Pcinc_033589 [Petrolisthes cinctipes]|uniref:cyclin-dependent kinase n=1 Tax=Petrolisthes cinctipes TaxID=88211 RepID=A0AAE1ES49_PETCI|nr:hypothetical protein Pcinc_033589 [Petrolisthes cinctipes]
MDSHEEDGEIREEGRPRHQAVHITTEDNDVEEDDFSMSSYDGDQGDSLDIKPPQAVVQRREKREKREKRERHRHKSERHKERHRRGQEERHRTHRRHRERGEGDRRDGRRHEKRHERSSKSERHAMEARSKVEKRKVAEREMRRRGEREREDYYVDEREQYERIDYHREHQGRSGMGSGGGGGGGGLGPSDYAQYHAHHRRGEERQALIQLSPRERAERERRMERILGADKQKELSQQIAESRRQRREEERREEQIARHRVGGGGGGGGSVSGGSGEFMSHRQHARPHSPSDLQSSHKRRKHHHHQEVYSHPDDPEAVTIVSDEDEEEMSYRDIAKPEVHKGSDEEGKKKKKKEEERGRAGGNQTDSVGSGSSDSESDSERVRSPTPPQRNQYNSDSTSTETDVEEEDKEETADKRGKDSGDHMSASGSAQTESGRSGTLSPSQAQHYKDTSPVEERSDREDTNQYLPDSSPESPLELKEQLPSYFPAIMGCRSVDEFECLNRIEEGTYGVVYRAREKATNQIVALKRLKMEKEKEGFPITSLREVNTLMKGQHENIVRVREIVVGSNMDKIYIVMDYVEHDLKSLMETMRQKKQMFTIGELKTLMRQLLGAVHHLHDNWILHRDLKTSNLLLSHRGILKVGDFGLAREYGSPLKHYTPIVVTLWYRAPELLLGAKQYTTHIDVWSVGCIFGELLGMEPMFPGKSEIDQLNKIFKDLGTPSEKIWPGYGQLPLVKKTQFADYPYNHLRDRFKARLSDQGFNLLNRFLTYNPAKRITCQEALQHDYFHREAPPPIDPAMFPTWPAKSENPHARAAKKTGLSPKPPSGGKKFKELVEGEDELAGRGFFLGGASSSGAGFVLKM